jgi:hypothetical protein
VAHRQDDRRSSVASSAAQLGAASIFSDDRSLRPADVELSAYFALVQIWSAISAAAILGAVNFALATVLFVIAARPPGGPELELATEIHGSAVEGLQLEAQALQSQLPGMIHHPLDGVLPLLIAPLITLLIRGLKKPAAVSPAATTAAEQK